MRGWTHQSGSRVTLGTISCGFVARSLERNGVVLDDSMMLEMNVTGCSAQRRQTIQTYALRKDCEGRSKRLRLNRPGDISVSLHRGIR